MKMTEPIPHAIQMKDFIYGLDEKIKREVRTKYVASFDEAVAIP